MRLLFIVSAIALLTGGVIATIKVPNKGGSERVLSSYRANPQKTLSLLEAAIFECVPESAKSPIGVQFTKTVIAPFYVKIVDLRMEGAPKDAFGAQLQKWIISNHPKLLTDLPDKDFLTLVSLLKRVGEDDTENCILSSSTAERSRAEMDANEGGLRL